MTFFFFKHKFWFHLQHLLYYYIVKPNKPTHLARSSSQTQDKIVINLTMITIQIIMLLETLIIERDVSL